MKTPAYQALLTAPNLLSCFRFAASPVLLWFAWHGNNHSFLILLAFAFLSDALDGFVARMTEQITELGATLDSWGDVITYLTIALSAWWLWPDVVKQEIFYVFLIISSYLLPAIVGIAKFGSFTSYHTLTVKCAAVAMSLSLYLLFLTGWVWAFRISAFICLLAAIEEISITLILKEKQSNIRSLCAVLRSSNLRDSS
ncbi:MAG: CDP-alcohol phosphatidyltransferase [Methylococcaceae bacterium]|nr:CDP-alcohol phosphatidyltransferase [Methylococcaceae bacterium]